MSVMIYDTANSAFKDIQAMQRYDPFANAWTDCTSAQVQENGVWVEKLGKKLLSGITIISADYYESGEHAGKMNIYGTYTSDITNITIGGINATLDSDKGTFSCIQVPTDNNSPQFVFSGYTNKDEGIVKLPFFAVGASASGSGGYTGKTGTQTVTYTPKAYCGITSIEVQAYVGAFMGWNNGVVTDGSVSTSTGYFSYSSSRNTTSTGAHHYDENISAAKSGTISQFGTFTIYNRVTSNTSNWYGGTGIVIKYNNPNY